MIYTFKLPKAMFPHMRLAVAACGCDLRVRPVVIIDPSTSIGVFPHVLLRLAIYGLRFKDRSLLEFSRKPHAVMMHL